MDFSGGFGGNSAWCGRHQRVVAAINDYPTAARADYVFGCMAANEQTRDNLQRCACSIEVIAFILVYDDYVAAETVLSMR